MPDVPKESLKLDIQPTYLEATGHSKTKNVNYKVKLDFFGEVRPDHFKPMGVVYEMG
jgi:hypothetical protein